ncbi:hypothetical protein [Agarivorans sp. 1_MG-2023]|uniref:hypothetical protein n=1 Tax=Agarivorans sp. 1_MG-2023 TaxID=3062634 RepID=UPI0026E2EAFD|nr:hypothetical protein [Agarivorans sp. 1_MG-2023]MDO6765295.1 hypothetical protein [Agarivorans sp. 1_MG-2023]
MNKLMLIVSASLIVLTGCSNTPTTYHGVTLLEDDRDISQCTALGSVYYTSHHDSKGHEARDEYVKSVRPQYPTADTVSITSYRQASKKAFRRDVAIRGIAYQCYDLASANTSTG